MGVFSDEPSRKPTIMPTPKLSTNWSPHQAYAALDILEQLHQMIWNAYENELVEIILLDQQLERHAQQTDACSEYDRHDFDQDIPF